MRGRKVIGATGVFIVMVGTACAQKGTVGARHLTPVSPRPIPMAIVTVSQLEAVPATIPFTANSPGTNVQGGALATITWNMAQGKSGHSWALYATATTPVFVGCATVPASVISVKCVSASVTGGGLASAGCAVSSFAVLPSSSQGVSVASGNEGDANSHNYTVVLSFQLADSWRYIANECPLDVVYTVIAQ